MHLIIDQNEQKTKTWWSLHSLPSNWTMNIESLYRNEISGSDLQFEDDHTIWITENKIDQDFTNSYYSKDVDEKTMSLIRYALWLQENTHKTIFPCVLVCLTDPFLTSLNGRDIALWLKKFYDLRDRIQINYPFVKFKLCLDSHTKTHDWDAIEVGMRWCIDWVSGKIKPKQPISIDTPIAVRDKSKTPILALCEFCDGITEETAYQLLILAGSWKNFWASEGRWEEWLNQCSTPIKQALLKRLKEKSVLEIKYQ